MVLLESCPICGSERRLLKVRGEWVCETCAGQAIGMLKERRDSVAR